MLKIKRAAPVDSIEAVATQAVLCQRQGKLKEAARCYQQVLAQRPHWPEVHYNLGLVLEQQQNFTAAIDCYQQAITQNPNYLKAYYSLAIAFQKLGHPSETIRVYQQIIERHPNEIDAYNNLGCAWVQQGEFETAIKIYQDAIARSPENATLYNNLAQAYGRQGKFDQSITHYLRAIQFDPNQVEAYQNLGNLFQKQKLYGTALVYFQRVLELQPDSIAAHSACAWSFLEQNQFTQALSHFKQVLESQPSFVEAYLQWLDILKESDELDRARCACGKFIKAIQQNQPSEVIWKYLAQTHFHLGNTHLEYRNFAQAETHYQKAIQILPQWLEPHLQWGFCLSGQRQWKAAARVYHQALTHHPNSTELRAFLDQVQRQLQVDLNSPPQRLRFKLAPGTPLPNPSEPNCGGLECQRCLKPIVAGFSPVHLGQDVYHCSDFPSQITTPAPTVTIIPQGRAWVAPQKNWWNVCNAIAILNPEDELLPEVSPFYPAPLPGCRNPDPTLHQLFHLEELPPLESMGGTVAVLSGLSGNVYFHWMVDILPRIGILQQQGINLEEIDWFLINSVARPFQQETLERLGIPKSKILESDRHPYIQAEKLIVPSYPATVGWVTPQVIEFQRNLFASAIDSPSSATPERIYITRKTAKYRRLLNEAEVTDYLSQYGFVNVELETLSVAEQARLFSQAKVIVAPHGAGLTNLLFCQPGTLVVELLCPSYVQPYYWVIAQRLKLQHYYILGQQFKGTPLRKLMYQSPLSEDILIPLKSLQKLLKVVQLDGMMEHNKKTSINGVDPGRMMVESSHNFHEPADELHQKAIDAFRNQQIPEALKFCQAAIQSQPNFAAAHKTCGDLQQVQGELEAAKISYQQAIKLQPNFVEARVNLGNLYARQKHWNEAIQSYQTALDLRPNSADIYRNLAQVWKTLGRKLEAADCFYEAYRLNPQDVTAGQQVKLGRILLQQMQVTKALTCFETALKMYPNFPEAQQGIEQAQQLKRTLQSTAIEQRKILPFKPASQTRETPSTVSTLEAAQTHYDNKEFEAAAAECRRWLETNPNSVEAHALLGKALQGMGQTQAAIRSYETVIQLQPEDAIAYYNLGSLHAQQKAWNLAISAFSKAISLQPTLAAAYQNLGKVWQRLGDLPKAAAYWYHAINLQPDLATAREYLALGNTLMRQGHRDKAKACFCHILDKDPNHAEAHHNLAEILATQHQWDEAIVHYRQAIALKPDSFATYNSLGRALTAQGDVEAALECYNQAIRLNPQLLTTTQALAGALVNPDTKAKSDPQQMLRRLTATLPQPQTPAAATDNTALAEVSTFDLQRHLQTARQLYEQQEYERCIHYCQQVVQQQPKTAAAYKLWGMALADRGDSDRAKRFYQQALALQPQDGEVYLALARLYCKEQQWQQAGICYQKALQLQPNAEVYRQLAEVWDKQGNTTAAEDSLYEALRLDPQSGTLQEFLTLAESLWQRGQWSAAIGCYQQVVALDPHHVSAHQRLAQGFSQQGDLEQAVSHYRQAYELVAEGTALPTSEVQPLELPEEGEVALLLVHLPKASKGKKWLLQWLSRIKWMTILAWAQPAEFPGFQPPATLSTEVLMPPELPPLTSETVESAPNSKVVPLVSKSKVGDQEEEQFKNP